MPRRMLAGEGITPAPVCEQGLRFEGEENKVRNVTDSPAQPRVAARALLVQPLKGKQEAHD